MGRLGRLGRSRAAIDCISDAAVAIVFRPIRLLKVALGQALLVVSLGFGHRRSAIFKAAVTISRVLALVSSPLRSSMARLVLFEGELTVLILLEDLLILLLRLVFNRVLLVLHLLSHWVLLVSGACHK